MLDRRHEQHVTSLDAAIRIIAKVGLLNKGLIRSDQRELLRLMLERVVVKPEEKVRLELHAPFAYFNEVSKRVQHGD